MKTRKKILYAMAVGFASLFIWNVILFLGQIWWNSGAAEIFGSYTTDRRWQPMELKIQTGEDGSCQPGQLSCSFDMKNGDWQFGFSHSTLSYVYGPPEQILCNFPTEGDSRAISFIYDDTIKQIIVQQVENCWDLPGRQNRNAIGYIGPKGYSKTAAAQDGIFEKPLFGWELWRYYRTSPNTYSLLFYDSAVCRFYRIDMEVSEKKIKKQTYYNIQLDSIRIIEGPVQKQPDWNPVQVGHYMDRIESWERKLGLFYSNLNLKWEPSTKNTPPLDGNSGNVSAKDPNMQHGLYAYDARRNGYVSAKDPNIHPISGDAADRMLRMEDKRFFVLHQNGRIDYLDDKTLTIVQCAGYLPEIGFYRTSASRRPRDMADYAVEGIYDPNGCYVGTAVAAISRDGITASLDFYNAKGKLTAHKSPEGNWYHDANNNFGFALVVDSPDGAAALTVRYLLENLQPLLLRLLDMPAARWVEPDNRYCTLFVHPNSLIGLVKVEFDRFIFWTQLSFLMLPSLVVSLWLGIKARRKAVSLGFDAPVKDTWFIAILAFGIPAYITFKLMLPKERMITCANCGNLRRVEFDVCQSCKRDWQKTKSLTTPPDWSVKDLAKAATDTSPAS